jgi:hypothetical protein
LNIINDLINQAVEWFKGIFYSEQEKKPVKIESPFPKKPYNKGEEPDLNQLPSESVKFAARWLVSHGLSLEGASALIGNLWRESYLNPRQLQIVGKSLSGPGKGLAQWTDSTLTKTKSDDGGARWDYYQNQFFPSLKNSHNFWKDYELMDAEPQLSYIIYELKKDYPGVWRELSSPGSISSKSNAVLKRYEVAAKRNDPEEQNFRTNLSEKVYSLIKGDKKLASLATSRKDNKA